MYAIDYAKAACDTMMRKFAAPDLPPKGRFHYHQGVFLSVVYKTYEITGDERYYQYVKDWIDSLIDADGRILNYDKGQLDDIMPGVLLYPLLDRTHDPRYQKALDELIAAIRSYPKNPDGGFWHKNAWPNQMWLDGLYMGGPIAAEYSKRYNQPDLLDNSIFQTILMERVTREPQTGLWRHAYDYTKSAPWADPVTGMSPEFWGRAMGWVVVAVQQIAGFMDTSHPQYDTIRGIVRNLLTALCRYQTESGLWYQVVDKAGEPGNWPEISCSCLYTGALFMAIENGVLSPDFLPYALKGYDGVINSLSWRGDDLIVGGVCIGTGVGDYAHYCARPTSENDLHGVGAFLIMCAQVHNHSR